MTFDTENHLRALRNFLGRMTANSRKSHGWVFDEEIAALDRAFVEIAADRNGLEKSALVIQALEKERRELCAEIAMLCMQLDRERINSDIRVDPRSSVVQK